MPIFAHPRFGPLKKPVFCLRSKVLGVLPTCFFVFFYINFVFFFMIFAYFPIFFCQIFCLSKRKLADFGSNLLCLRWSSHANFAEFSDLYGSNYPARPLYGWNYPVHPSVRLKLPSTPPVWLKLPSTPFCMVEIIQHAPCMVEITQHTLLYGWNYPVHPSVWFNLPSTPWKGRSS